MNESSNAKKCTKQKSKGHYSRKRKCWRKKVKAAVVGIKYNIILGNSDLEAAEISTVSISKVINVETDTREDGDKITGLGLWTQNSYTIFFRIAQNVSKQILYITSKYTPKEVRLSKLFIPEMQ